MRGARIPNRVLPRHLALPGVTGRLRRPASGLTAFSAVLAMSLTAGPATNAVPADPCALPRTAVHHSLGVDEWNTAYPRPTRTLDAVMVFLSFPDSEPRVDAAELAADYFPAGSRFFERASYGRFTLRPHPVKRWIEMPAASRDYGIQRDWDGERRAAYLRDAVQSADPVVDFSRYDIVYLVADPDAPGVDSDATKVVNLELPIEADGSSIRRVVTLFERHPPDRHVLAHETGHLFDLPDLYHRPEKRSAEWDAHVGDWDVMGSQFGLAPDLFGWHKWKLGWLDRRHVACVRDPGTSRHLLYPLEVPLRPRERDGTGRRPADTRLLVAPLSTREALVAEFRGPYGNDVDLCTSGLLLYRVRSDVASAEGPVRVVDTHPETARCRDRSVNPALADAPLAEGESHTVAAGGGVRFQVGHRLPSGALPVTVTRG